MTDGAPPEGPSAQEQHDSAAAYQESTREIDARIEKEMRKQGQPHRAQDFEITFEKFIASIYMSALMQLGLAAPQGTKPEVDLLGARQTIDSLAILQEKTKGNLTPAEQSMLQNVLYELRMAYLEVTNMLTHPPQGGSARRRQGPDESGAHGPGQWHFHGSADHRLRLPCVYVSRSA